MAETLDALVAHLGRKGGEPSLRQFHLGDARATDMGRRGELNVGQLTREKYGEGCSSALLPIMAVSRLRPIETSRPSASVFARRFPAAMRRISCSANPPASYSLGATTTR